MSEFSAADSTFMARALRLAGRGRYTAHPNPMVGCVIIAGNAIVGEGWHEKPGDAHAEINALRAAGDRAHGATAYVSLEPCAHHGRTPPCTDALIAAGVAEVVIARQDPYAAVDGRGTLQLEEAGIRVRVGLMRDTATRLLAGYLSRTTRGRPRVRAKLAASIDGSIAMADGRSQWITGPAARADVQRLRARSGAVMTGIGTVCADDPSLTVRDAAIATGGRQPLRIVLDSGLRMPLTAKMLALSGATIVYCCRADGRARLQKSSAEVVAIAGENGRVGLRRVLEDLGNRGVNDLLVEAGPVLMGSLLQQNLVDELLIYQAPHIMGSETMRMFATPAWTALADRAMLRITDRRRVGDDLRITAELSREDQGLSTQ